MQADASAGKLGVSDLKGGTFTISNIGNLGGTYTSPVINLPEIAIAGLGKTRATPRYDEQGNLVKASVMQVSGIPVSPWVPCGRDGLSQAQTRLQAWLLAPLPLRSPPSVGGVTAIDGALRPAPLSALRYRPRLFR